MNVDYNRISFTGYQLLRTNIILYRKIGVQFLFIGKFLNMFITNYYIYYITQ